ncbi:outer membrane protein assembly factor BamB family protein [Halobellus inordinatus]|uniref:outer membrane protein assembly factor BamB family protein n=1 Tax=Halobellus inordinatus TaxID=1126236 RepID=UPI002113F6CA|nr:PQQ-binding-like beta-propeller repeat protein [Halobellus ramosii]
MSGPPPVDASDIPARPETGPPKRSESDVNGDSTADGNADAGSGRNADADSNAADGRPTRRRVLASVAAVGAGLPLAGCGGIGTPGTETEGDTATETASSPTDTSPGRGPAPSVIGPWPQARADAANTGVAAGTGPLSSPSVRWTTASAGTIGAAVGVGGEADSSADHTGAYVVAEDGRVAAVDAAGEERWTATVDAAQFPPAVESGRVVVPERERLVVLDAATGQRQRTIGLPGGILYAPTVVGSHAFVGTFSGGVVAVDLATGETRWQAGDPSRSYPPVVVDGVAYVTARRWGTDETGGSESAASDDAGVFAALDTETGDRRWAVPLDGNPTAPPGYPDGVVYCGTHRGHVYAVDATTGETRWRETVGDWVTRGPTAAADGVYVVVLGEGPVKLTHDGSVSWRSTIDAGTNPVLDSGVALFGTNAGVVAVGRDDGEVRWRGETDAPVRFDVQVADGVAYAGDQYGTVLAFDVATGDRRWEFPFRPKTMSGPVVGPRTVAGGNRDGGTYDLLATDGIELSRIGSVGGPSLTPVFLGDEPGSSRETLLSGGGDGVFNRVRTIDYGDSPTTDLQPTPTPTATPGPDEPTATRTPHIDFPQPEQLWGTSLDVDPRSPLTYADGVAYVGTAEGIAAVDARDGDLRLRRDLGAVVSGAPAVQSDRVFVATRAGRLVALGIGGTGDSNLAEASVQWEVSVDAPVRSGPAVADGAVVVASESGRVASYTVDGDDRWEQTLDGEIYGGTATTSERVFVGTSVGEVVALERTDGSVAWRASAEGAVHGTPAVGGEGDDERETVYVGDHAGTVSAFAGASGDVRWRLSVGQWVDAPPAIGHGAVFVADQTGRVYAVVG